MAQQLIYNIVRDDGEPSSITAFHDDQEYVAIASHPRFDDLLALAPKAKSAKKIHEFIEIMDVAKALEERFARLSERVMIHGGRVLFDGDHVDNSLTKAIVDFFEAGMQDFRPLVLFMEKLYMNPTQHSIDQLFSFLQKNHLTIDQDGNIILYKSVAKSGVHHEDEYVSHSSGRAIVNGVWQHGQIPTSPGSIVEMPRRDVNHNPQQGCSTGLHAGTWGYASTFHRGSTVLRVMINPRDVVSVPNDSHCGKVRVCRYRVLAEGATGDDGAFFHVDADEMRTRVMEVRGRITTVVPKKAAGASSSGRRRRGDDKPKKARPAKKAAVKKVATPKKAAAKKAPKKRYYEDMLKADFLELPINGGGGLRWLAKEWEVDLKGLRSREDIASKLARAASARRRKALKPRDKVKITA